MIVILKAQGISDVCVWGGGGSGWGSNKTWLRDVDVHQKFTKEPSKGIGILILLKENAKI